MHDYNTTNYKAENDMINAIRSDGFEIADLEKRGKIQRFGHKKRQWCYSSDFLTSSGQLFILAICGDWSSDKPSKRYNSFNGTLQSDELTYLKKQIDFAKQQADLERLKLQEETSQECLKIWDGLILNGSSPYLEKKRLTTSFGARFKESNLVVPCFDIEGRLWSLQTIYPDGEKRFKKGGKLSETFFSIGDWTSAKRLFVAEGFSTAASVFMATNVPTIVAFNCGNLAPVAKKLKDSYPEKQIDICGDNDQWKKEKGNPGKEAAIKAAKAVGGNYFVPSFKSPESEPTDFNDLHCLEGLEVVRAQLISQSSDPVPKSRKAQASNIVDLAEGLEFFHTPDDEAFAIIEVDGHKENWQISGKFFKTWLQHQFFKKTGAVCNAQALTEAVATLEGRAKFEGKLNRVHTRIAEEGDSVFLDLCNNNWEIVEIDKNGWSVTNKSPVKFRRYKGMKSLPLPLKTDPSEALQKLRKFINVENEDDFRLIIAFLLSSLQPKGPYISLVLYGEQGSGKSTTVKVLRSLIDPNNTPILAPPKNTEDLMVTAKHNYMVAIDNMSYLSEERSDDFCRLATGGAISKRRLYTDDEELTLEATRPIILNGIDEFVVRGDLASRSIVLWLPVISDDIRGLESSFWKDFEEVRSEIFGALVSAASEALKKRNEIKIRENARMADAWHWISSGESAFGWQAGSTLKLFKQNQNEAFEGILAGSPLYKAILELMDLSENKFKSWKATPTTTLEKLNELRGDKREPKNWPSTARVLSNQLNRLAPQFRAQGINITMDRTHKGRTIEIWKNPINNDTSVTSTGPTEE